MTSRPYPVEFTDSVQVSEDWLVDSADAQFNDVIRSTVDALSGGTLRDNLTVYVMQPEAVTAVPDTLKDGTMRDLVIAPYIGPAEAVTASPDTLKSGTLRELLITYTNWEVESISATADTLTGGELI